MPRLIFCFLLLVFQVTGSFGQCPGWSNLSDCGSLNALGGVCNSNTIFCVGDSVGVMSLSAGNIDSSFICWDDGTVQKFAGNFQGCIKHYYNNTPDSCVGGNGQIQKFIRIGIKKTCSQGESFHYVITPIDIKFKPNANFSASPLIVCVNQPVTITNNSCPNTLSPVNYWDFGDGTNSSSQFPGTHTYTSPGTYTINYTLSNSCGTDTDSETIIVLPPTVILPVITLNDQCTPAQFVPDVNSQNVITFLWTSNPGAGMTITAPIDSQPDFNVTAAGTYNVNLSVTGCCNSIGSICQWDTSLTFYQGPNLTQTPIPIFCNSTTLSPVNYITITGNISQYNWSFPGGSPSSSNSPNPGNITYNTPGIYPLTLVVNSPCGTDSIVDSVRILPPTTIAPVVTLAGNCAPLTINGNMNGSNSTGYSWNLSPGSIGTILTPTNQQTVIDINSSGTFIISATSMGCCNAPQSNCNWDTTITLIQGPNISLTPIPVFCNSTTINPANFISVTGSNIQYNWQFPGGIPSSSGSANPGNVVYGSPGIYPLTLIVNNACGTDSILDSVRVLPPTIISPTVVLSGNCAPLNINGNMNAVNATGYAWNLSPGSIGIVQNPANQQTLIDINNPGTFTISAVSNGCCTAPQSDCNWDTTITIVQGPDLSSSALPIFCSSGSITPSSYFSITGSVSTYNWDFTGGSPASSSNLNPGTVNYGSPGTYTVSLIVSGICGTDSINEILIIGAPPILNLVSSGLFGCDSLTVIFVNTSPAGQTYNWTAPNGNFTNGTSSASNEPSVLFSSPGIYQIDVSAVTPGCNPVSQTFNIEIGEAPDLSVMGAIDDVCDSVYLNLTDYFLLNPSTSDSGYTWNVFFNNSNYFTYSGTNPTSVYIQDTGIYVVSVLAWNACDSIVLTDTFTFYFPPTLAIPSDTTVCKGSGSIPLIATPGSGNWTWNGDTIVSGVFNTGLTLQEENYMLYSFGILTCEVRDSFLVTVIGANLNAGNDTVLCSNGLPFNLSGIPVPGIWSGEGVADSLTGYYDPSLTINSPDPVVYTYFDPVSGCIVRDTILVTVFQPTTGGFSLPDTACIYQPIVFSDTIPNTNAHWDFGDGSGWISSNTTTHTYTQPGLYMISLIIENIYGCTDTVFNDIEISEPPNAIFSLDIHNGCAILPVTITNQSTLYGGSTYNWDYGNGVSDILFNPGLIFFDQGPGDSTIYTIELMVVNGCGIAFYNDSIVVYPIPVPEFGVIFSDSCSPALVMFNNITTGNPQTYQWYINGVFVSSDSILPPQVLLADSTDSTYVIMLIAINYCGQDTIVKDVIIHPNQVTAFFNSDLVYGCKPLQVTFTSFVAANSVIQWEFGDGTFGSGNTVSHIYDTAGVFTVWQYVDNYCGFDSVSQTIEVLDQPDLSFSIPEKQCNNVPLNILNTSVNISGVIWDFGDGSPMDSISNSPVHLYTTPGFYTITMIGFASLTGCTDTIYATIEIIDHPLASFNLSPIDGCIPLSVNLISTSSGAAYYIWDMGNGDTIVGPQLTYIYLQQGLYSVALTVIDNNGCKDDTAYSYINVYPIPVAIFEFTQAPMCALPATVSFTNLSTGASSYSWDFNTYGNSNQQDPSLTFIDPAVFNATLISQNIFGCADTLIKPVNVYAKPIALFTPDSAVGCPPLEITFNNTSLFFNQAYWDFGDGGNSSAISPVHIYANAGAYSTTLIVGIDSLCFDTLTINDHIVVEPQPTSDFTIQEITDTIVNPSGLFAFLDNSTDALKWFWSFGDGTYSSDQNPIHRYFTNGTMYVMLVVYNEYGCPDTSYQTIIVNYLGSLFIPNAFSPDAGTAETMYFIPKGVGIQEYLIEVFSPYGEKVWSSTKLLKGQPGEKWDGTLNGKNLPQGAYVWKAYAIFENGEVWKGMQYENKKASTVGTVTIIR